MQPSDGLEKVIDGKRYRVSTATLLAHDRYWDGNNHHHGGRNCFLYATPRGHFFAVHLSMWVNDDRQKIVPLDRAEAQELYEGLHEHAVESFPGVTVEEA